MFILDSFELKYFIYFKFKFKFKFKLLSLK
jgi:hypothetical protein